jgi:U2-associated protein SR140
MSNPHQFPNVRDKLSAPSKKSAFEKARLEAEEKRKREEAETAAVYKDFVASFDDDPSPAPSSGGYNQRGGGGGFGRGGFRGGMGPVNMGKRHFSGAPGRGGLGGNGGFGGSSGLPPPRKRNLGDAFERDEEEGGIFSSGGPSEREKRRMKEGNTGLLAFENSGPKRRDRYNDDDSGNLHISTSPSASVYTNLLYVDHETSAAHPKPTLLLSSLPPSITKQSITTLLSSTPLKIDSIRIIPASPPSGPSQPSPSIRKAATALVTLSSETPVSDIDAAVSSLNGRYLGFGFWLSIVRHLSSTVAGNAPTGIPIIGSQSHPFGAKAPPAAVTGGRGGPHRGGFAPPPSFAPPGRGVQQSNPNALQVHVQPPQDLKTLKLIHRTIETLLTNGPEFEALLMSQENVRNDAKFAWLWDARSQAGVYYRWKLWEIVTGYSIDKPYTPTVDIFDNSSYLWVPPKKPLKYEFAGSLKDVVEDYEFRSEELDDDDSADEGDHHHDGRPISADGKKAKGYLGVLERAKLIHLISRVPTVTSKVRRGDVGRVMAFAMEHAEGGMGEEVVEILVSNVLKPLAFTKAAKSEDDDSETEGEKEKEGEVDTSSAKIVGLWLISDVLSNSSLGVRAAWRYRQLFDTALRDRGVFAKLGEIYRDSGWGRMKAEKFRRMVVEGVLEGWEVCFSLSYGTNVP